MYCYLVQIIQYLERVRFQSYWGQNSTNFGNHRFCRTVRHIGSVVSSSLDTSLFSSNWQNDVKTREHVFEDEFVCTCPLSWESLSASYWLRPKIKLGRNNYGPKGSERKLYKQSALHLWSKVRDRHWAKRTATVLVCLRHLRENAWLWHRLSGNLCEVKCELYRLHSSHTVKW